MNTEKELPAVLYVEDDDIAIRLVRLTVSSLCKLEVVKDGYSAIDMAKKNNYDAFILDINLGISSPSGIEVVRMLRQMPEYAKTPIIALTAYALDGDREEFIGAGCSHYITKPFTRAELQEIFREAL